MKKIVVAIAFVVAIAMSLNAASTHLSLDNRKGTRDANVTERIRLSPAWETEAIGAVAKVRIGSVAVKDATEPGSFDWTPTQGGTYQFTHAVFVNGVQVGKTLSAMFVVPEFVFEYFEQTGHAYVKSYFGTAERVEIPNVVYVDANGRQVADEASAAKTYQVVGVSSGGFARNKTMKSVVFPASIQTIDSEAFYGCESLEQVTIPETVTSIGESAFAWCPKLKRAEVLGSLELPANCFAYDSALETVIIGDKVTSLQKGYKDSDGALGSPFLGCEKLREISIGSGITYIEPHVFNGLKSLETIRFGAVIRGVYHHAFSGCESLKTIVGTLRPSVVGDEAFSGVPAYFGAQFDDCTAIGMAAFWNCKGFGGSGETHTLDLPKITSIGDGAFEGCVNMSAIQLGAQLKTIGANAFKDSGAQVVCFDGPPPSVGEGAFALPGEPQGVLRNWDSWQDWQSAIDLTTGMWHGLRFSQIDGVSSPAVYTFRAIDDKSGTFDPQKVTAIVNMRISGEGNTATYVEIQRCQLGSTGVCSVPIYMGGDYEVWFEYGDETWKCTIDYDRFSAPLERNREMTVYFRRGDSALTFTVYLYADEKATAPYAKLNIGDGTDIGVLPKPPWPTPTWLYEFSGWRRRHYNVQSGKWEIGDPIPAGHIGQDEADQGADMHLVATWKWDLGGDDDFKTWEKVQTEEYDKVVVKSAKIKDGETSEFSLAVEGEGVFSFLWKTSTESGRKFASVSALRSLSSVEVPTWDHAEFLVDGEVVATRDGESQWEKVTVNLSGRSSHTVTWRYAKDASGSEGEDCVWVSDIQLDAFPELVISGNVLTGFRGTIPEGYELTIPDGVTVVATNAFAGCQGLRSVKIPSSVTSIDSFAFMDCTGLKSVTISSAVTGGGRGTFIGLMPYIPFMLIGDGAFSGCSGLVSVAIPSHVIEIGENAFDGCSGLTSVYVSKGDAQRVEGLYQWPSNVEFIEKIDPPTVSGDANATVTGDAETGFVIKPSEGKTTVEVLIPQGVDAEKVTVEVSPKVTSVKPNGAKVKVVNAGADITEFLNIPAADRNGAIDLASATVKDEIVKEAMDPSKGAKIELNATDPKLKTAATREGLFYQLREGEMLDGMGDGDFTVGNGQPWSPKITVKGGDSAFYSIDVRKSERSFIIIRPILDYR